MDFLLETADKSVYGAQALVTLAGVWFFLLVAFRTFQKRFRNAAESEQFLSAVREELQRKNFDGVAELCDSPRYWSKAVPQLILVALENRSQGIAKVKKIVAQRFEHEVLADLEYRMSWIGTVVKTAPMLGLQGTVIGMINAFRKIAAQSAKTGTDPATLANDISFALWTTAIGLFIAIPFVLASNFLQVRIGKLQDSVQRDLGAFLEDFEAAIATDPRRSP